MEKNQPTAPAYSVQSPQYNGQNGMPQVVTTTPMAAQGEPPKNFLGLSIFATICCCLPLGIAAIIFSQQVNQKFALGDKDGAESSSLKARNFCIAAIVIGICWIGAVVGLRVAYNAYYVY